MGISRQEFKKIGFILGSFVLLELISLLGFFNPVLMNWAFVVSLLAMLVISSLNLRLGLLIVLAELIVGSKGYLLFFEYSGQMLSWRIGLWAIFMLVFAVFFIKSLVKEGKKSEYIKRIKAFPYLKHYLVLAVALILGLLWALMYRHSLSNIFLDFNNWLYFILVIPLVSLKWKKRELAIILFTGALWLSLKTLILLGIFSYNSLSSPFYMWLRKSLVGEMTLLETWNRVFIQSQSFVAIAFLMLLAFVNKLKLKKQKKDLALVLILGAIFMATIIVSLSRSFWLGLVVASLTLLIVIFRAKGFKALLRSLAFIIISLLLAILVIFIATPENSGSRLGQQISSRVSDSGEAAVSSRWALLRPLLREILDNPLTGKGYGAEVSYYSQDPRVLETSPSGLYSTYAFEWGYLDIWLKVGLIGLLAYLWLLFILTKDAYLIDKKSQVYWYWGLGAGIIFLVATHFFTPYLNHPLGIGFIITSSCIIGSNRVY
jgi:O-antigen ligase